MSTTSFKVEWKNLVVAPQRSQFSGIGAIAADVGRGGGAIELSCVSIRLATRVLEVLFTAPPPK